MGAFYGFVHIRLKLQDSAGICGNIPAGSDQLRTRPVFFRRAGNEVHAHFRAANHQRVSHVVSGISHVDQFDAFQRAEMLPDRQEIRQDLGRMELIGQAVPYRDSGITIQVLHDLLPVSPVLNPVKHTAQNPRCIGNAFLFTYLAPGGIQIGTVHSQVISSDLKGAASARARFLKDQGDIFSGTAGMRHAGFFLLLQIRCQVKKTRDLFRREIKQFQELFFFQCKHAGTPPNHDTSV